GNDAGVIGAAELVR
ncbi:MAG: hypothetical protein COU52_04615, partial [Candidatus Omnitrophica bacterium CG10_big_fil_rev_8_21_14_0_10_43_8]